MPIRQGIVLEHLSFLLQFSHSKILYLMADYNRNQGGSNRSSNQEWNENRGRSNRNQDNDQNWNSGNQNSGSSDWDQSRSQSRHQREDYYGQAGDMYSSGRYGRHHESDFNSGNYG